MKISSILTRYIAKEFFKIIFSVTFVFFCLGIVLNLFEEINFFKDKNTNVVLPLLISLLKVPNIILNLFPFIVLISSVWLFLKLIKSDELTAIKASGVSNLSILTNPCFLAFLLGGVIVMALSPITSQLSQKYFSIKGEYSKNNDYLAAITVNGIWIKEKNEKRISIIKSDFLEENLLKNLTIYIFDENNNPKMRIESLSANINDKNWILKNAKIFENDQNVKVENHKELIYKSAYDINSIKNLYSDLDTVSFWNLKSLIKTYQSRGYSTKEIESKFQKSIAFPFFLASMVLLAGVSIMGVGFRGNYLGYILFSIISCIIIYYFNDFSKALGDTGKLPIYLSVWMPIIIIGVFGSIGLIHVNQK